jgi:hypothetical protein
MSDETTVVHPACAICERRLLPGERECRYVTREGNEVTVCELCKARAEAGGWLPPEQAATRTTTSSGGRRRQRGQLFGGLRRRVEQQRERRPRSARGGEPEEASADREEPRRERPAPRGHELSAAREDRGGEPSSAGPDLTGAIAAFNAAEQPRTVSGLSRSLGAPKASGLAVRTASGANGVRLTVAWELAWYQWEVGPGKRGPELRQIAKGETIDQLRAADRQWNLSVAEDGTLSQKRGGGLA